MSSLDAEGFRISNSDEERRSWDQRVHARTTIESTHRMIHDGFSFHATHRAATLADTASFDVLIAVSAATFSHWNGLLYSLSDSPCDIETYEGTTTSADGTVITPYNRNRNSSNTPGAVLTHTPTITDLGTKIHDRFVPDQGGTGINDVGAISPNFGEEWITIPSTKYLMRLTNNSGAAITFTLEALWYEPNYET